jgi:predicted nicotinamide N-methyase
MSAVVVLAAGSAIAAIIALKAAAFIWVFHYY